MEKAKVIVLASGGLDSTLVMYKLLMRGYEVVPFFSDYSQSAFEGECRSIYRVASWMREEYGSVGIGILKNVVTATVDVGLPVAAAPGRILAIVGAAAIWAYTSDWGSGSIAIGIHMGDKDQDSCRVGYEDDLDRTLQILTQDRMNILTPLMGLSREDIAQSLHEIGIPWDYMWNCYWHAACGSQSTNMDYRCPGCRRKQLAMQTVGLSQDEWRIPNRLLGSPRAIARRDWKW